MNARAQEIIYSLALAMSYAGADGISEGGCVWCSTRGDDSYTVKMALEGLHLQECPVLSIALLSKPSTEG